MVGGSGTELGATLVGPASAVTSRTIAREKIKGWAILFTFVILYQLPHTFGRCTTTFFQPLPHCAGNNAARKFSMKPGALPAFDPETGELNVLVETPKGCRTKFAYDEETGLFKLKKLLPAGMVFPFDFGFIPST